MRKFVVTITREFGSLGRPIAKRLSELLEVEFYDRDIVDQAAEKVNEDSEEEDENIIFPTESDEEDE